MPSQSWKTSTSSSKSIHLSIGFLKKNRGFFPIFIGPDNRPFFRLDCNQKQLLEKVPITRKTTTAYNESLKSQFYLGFVQVRGEDLIGRNRFEPNALFFQNRLIAGLHSD